MKEHISVHNWFLKFATLTDDGWPETDTTGCPNMEATFSYVHCSPVVEPKYDGILYKTKITQVSCQIYIYCHFYLSIL